MICRNKCRNLFWGSGTRAPNLIFTTMVVLIAVFLFYGLPGSASAQETAVNKNQILNVYNASVSNLNQLTTYDELVAELNRIAGLSKDAILVGPLVNSRGTGLLPADESLMNAIIDTVPQSTGLTGNTIENFGSSTQGRAIMAARAGNFESGRKVMIISQQHGNEVTSTEAVLNFLHYLAVSNDNNARKIRQQTDILFIVRANPDGGEADMENCLMADEIPFWGFPFADGSTDCALQRFNVDGQAGFSSLFPTTGDLWGAANIGFDTNRYHYALLDGPIYPFETQAMVYALKKFAPEFMLDLHNQNIKIRCDYTSQEEFAQCMEGSRGMIIDGTVQAGSITIAPTDADIQTRSERMGAHLLTVLNKNIGAFGRFAQASSSLPPESRTTVDAAMELGIVSNWLEVKCNSEIIGYGTIHGGSPSLGVILGMPFMPSNFQQLVGFHEAGIREYLLAVADGLGDITEDNGGFDTNPAWEAPNFDLFIVSDQLSDILVQSGYYPEPIEDDARITIAPIQ